ncbi:MAG: ABC transporter ATP-binding protein [Nitrospinaceae bacterium]|jgi:branched-chain amino acid transport system ATP-binding protein|nr:ABC transporter ATP-binding protein [Nitrospinaceae bacterium]|tara:strand:- start:1386 stop:2153 length:768 start_codon:yes stop_codon:yes gene_type:complete
MNLLEVRGLSKVFGGVRALEELHFNVGEGLIHSIIGPNGAGKTTLFNIITGLYKPDAGEVRFAGKNLNGLAPHRLATLGISRTFQNLQIFFNMSVLENVMVGRHLHTLRSLTSSLLRLPSMVRDNAACRLKAEELLEWVGLAEYKEADARVLPYGALKRLEIARAVAIEPRLLLLDEPAAGCNVRETQEIDALIQQVSEQGVTVILVEHDMRLVMDISDHILVINYGRWLAEGTAEEVRNNPEVVTAYLGNEARG